MSQDNEKEDSNRFLSVFNPFPATLQEANLNPSVNISQPVLQMSQEKSLNFDQLSPLGLAARVSIENVLPIPKNMLSHSEDAFHLQNRQYQQNQFEHPCVKIEELGDDLIQELGLEELISDRNQSQTTPQNTKNVLRNLGNAQNHYILYHEKAKQYIESQISNPKQFYTWVRNIKLQKFQHYKKIWGTEEQKLFARVYRHLSWQFHCEQSVPYILSSRIKRPETRSSHLKHIYRFLEGVKQPINFAYFKKT